MCVVQCSAEVAEMTGGGGRGGGERKKCHHDLLDDPGDLLYSISYTQVCDAMEIMDWSMASLKTTESHGLQGSCDRVRETDHNKQEKRPFKSMYSIYMYLCTYVYTLFSM